MTRESTFATLRTELVNLRPLRFRCKFFVSWCDQRWWWLWQWWYGDDDDSDSDDDGDDCNAENGVGQPASAQISLQVLCELMAMMMLVMMIMMPMIVMMMMVTMMMETMVVMISTPRTESANLRLLRYRCKSSVSWCVRRWSTIVILWWGWLSFSCRLWINQGFEIFLDDEGDAEIMCSQSIRMIEGDLEPFLVRPINNWNINE